MKPRRYILLALAIGVAAGATLASAAARGGDAPRRVTTAIPYGPLTRQKLDVYAPQLTPQLKPVIVFFYGGSWSSGRRQDYAPLGKVLASKGFVAVIVDYQLVPAVHFPVFLQDSARAVEWVHDNIGSFGGDVSRLFLLGHSAGAYNAVMIALDPRYLSAFGSNPAVIRGVATLAGPFDFLPLKSGAARQAFGKAKTLQETQPITFVSSQSPAMLLATGTADAIIDPRNTTALAVKLRAAGADVTVKTYAGIGHAGILEAITEPRGQKTPVLDDILAFVARQCLNNLR